MLREKITHFDHERIPERIDRGVVAIDGSGSIGAFIEAAKDLRIWEREPTLRMPG